MVQGPLLDCLILGVSYGVGMALLGFPLPVLVGLVTGACDLVPVVGGELGGFLGVLLALPAAAVLYAAARRL